MSTTSILAPWERLGLYIQLQDIAASQSLLTPGQEAAAIDTMIRFWETSTVLPHPTQDIRRMPITGSGLAGPLTGHSQQGLPNPVFSSEHPVTALLARNIFALWGDTVTEADPSVVTEYTDPVKTKYAAVAASMTADGAASPANENWQAFDCFPGSVDLSVPPVVEGDGGDLSMTVNWMGGFSRRTTLYPTSSTDDGTDFGQAYDVVFAIATATKDMHSADFSFVSNAVKGPTRDTTNKAPESNHLGLYNITCKLRVPMSDVASEEADLLMNQYEGKTNVQYTWTWTAGSFGTGNGLIIDMYCEIDTKPVVETINDIQVLTADLKVVDDGTNAPYTISSTTGSALSWPTAV